MGHFSFMDNKRELPDGQEKFDLYGDIEARTNGEIYLGVVGPVRSGKSTFVKRFMDLCVLPHMQDEYSKKQAMDELPQSGTGKTITTTEPKFIPSEAAQISLMGDDRVKVRLIDCVGYMVDGAVGHMEDGEQRMVHTPWFSEEIPFTKAAEIGTQKVIEEHSTIGIVVTTDGSFTDIPAKDYEPALAKTIGQLGQMHKPFIVLVNTDKPYGEAAIELAEKIASEYGVTALPINIAQMKKEDIDRIMQEILVEFPVSAIHIDTPKWFHMLACSHPVKQAVWRELKEKMGQYRHIRDMKQSPLTMDNEYVSKLQLEHMNLANGCVEMTMKLKEDCYYQLLSDLLGMPVESEYELFDYLKSQAGMRTEYEKVRSAMESVRQKGYGVVTPGREEITLQEPEVIHHGSKFGVKIKAQSPSIHMIKANIETEIAPIVGTKEQAEDLIAYIGKGDGTDQESGIWETNIFGKTVEQMVQDGIAAKVSMIGDESQIKLQDTMQKIVNDTNGGLVCIII